MRAMRTVAHGSWSELLIQSLASSVKLASARAPAPRAVATRLSASGRRPDLSSLGSATSTGSKTRTTATPAQRRWSRANSQRACSLSSSERTAGTGRGKGTESRRTSRMASSKPAKPEPRVIAADRSWPSGATDDVGLGGQPGLVQRVDGRQLLRRQAQEVVGPAPVDVGVEGAQVVTLRPSGAIGERRFRKLVSRRWRRRARARPPSANQAPAQARATGVPHASWKCFVSCSRFADPGSLIPFVFSWYAPRDDALSIPPFGRGGRGGFGGVRRLEVAAGRPLRAQALQRRRVLQRRHAQRPAGRRPDTGRTSASTRTSSRFRCSRASRRS